MLCLALAGALLDGERERRLAATGLLILGLALAAWDAGSLPALDPTPPGRLGRGFLIGNGGLLWLGWDWSAGQCSAHLAHDCEWVPGCSGRSARSSSLR